MTQFHEGQEVAVGVTSAGRNGKTFSWCKAVIEGMHGDKYLVKFADGSYKDFDADYIRLPQSEWDILRAARSCDSFPSDHECADGTNE